ncbi:hypothetical protein [Amycolatopsis sp. NBC_00438]|uniref:hypothetical protein n=1 Tax=Amycolatopsis sp. NBC_00438 TaxID=2903558 RepID=UPI002E24A70A
MRSTTGSAPQFEGALATLKRLLRNSAATLTDWHDVTWLAVLGTLLGTVIGSVSTVLSNSLASRAARRERLASEAQRREARRQAIEEFLEAAQEVDRVASHQEDRPPEVIHRLWLRNHRLAIVASNRLQDPLKEFVDALDTSFWEGTPDGRPLWRHLHKPRDRFGLAARTELNFND